MQAAPPEPEAEPQQQPDAPVADPGPAILMQDAVRAARIRQYGERTTQLIVRVVCSNSQLPVPTAVLAQLQENGPQNLLRHRARHNGNESLVKDLRSSGNVTR